MLLFCLPPITTFPFLSPELLAIIMLPCQRFTDPRESDLAVAADNWITPPFAFNVPEFVIRLFNDLP
tara:strand:+ start:461 stop:661 length:201 start_codon:yes stop_codon:yes gene_type:complete